MMVVLFLLGMVSNAQTNTITKPDIGQTEYIVNSASGDVNLQASNAIILQPGTHIQSGSFFVAQIVSAASGITVNTQNLPIADFEIVFDGSTIDNLTSGSEQSEVFVDTTPAGGGDVSLLVNVASTNDRSALNLRINKIQGVYSVEVFQNGQWRALSTEFYDVEGDTVTFTNGRVRYMVPFTLNLVDGVQYDRSVPLEFELSALLSAQGASLQITGPNEFLANISPDVENNKFIWDGTQAQSGLYRFQLTLQQKIFNGQFIIQ